MLVGSSDMMFRNLNERIEVLLSVPDLNLRKAILENMLKISLRDNVKARRLQSDGTYVKVVPKPGEEIINSQSWLIQNRGIWNEQPKEKAERELPNFSGSMIKEEDSALRNSINSGAILERATFLTNLEK